MFLKLVLIVTSLLHFSVHAESLTFGESTPEKLFKQSSSELKNFLELIENRSDLSLKQKEAFKNLAGVGDGSMAGDGVLEHLSSQDVAWFYGKTNSTLRSLIEANVTEKHYEDCLSRRVCVMVSKSSQRLYAFYEGVQVDLPNEGKWSMISTARPGKWTPNGFFTINELAHAERTSGLYPGAGLFYAMQLHGNIFIHGTNKSNYSRLGGRASAGCVRTTFVVAEFLNMLMREVGGRRSNQLANQDAVRAIIDSSVPNKFLQYY